MKIGFVGLPLSGHLNPMTALARKMQSRGHDVTFIGVPDAEALVRPAGVNFVAYCEKEFPLGSIGRDWGHVAKMHGKEIVVHTMNILEPSILKPSLEHLPAKIKETGVEALVLDTAHFFIELVPMSMDIPYVHVWNLLNFDFTGTTPIPFFSWLHENTSEALVRNAKGLEWAGELMGPVAEVAMAYAEKIGLKVDWSDPSSTTSKLAVISQLPREFDFPNIPWPSQFHYTGPFHDGKGRELPSFPWEKLDGKPLIYASLGTLVNGLDHIYQTILGAVGMLPDVQLVLSIGKNVDLDDLGQIPSNTIVVRSAPQIELLKRAALCITHGGLNTALESLAQGVPMVAIPIGYEQPGVSSRIAYQGVGRFVEASDLTVASLSEMIQEVRSNPSYRDRAHYFQNVIANANGLEKAAEILEKVFAKN
jgi:zeaxanthin glucosyltransferase